MPRFPFPYHTPMQKETIYPCLLLLNDIHVSKDNIPEFTANWREALDICRRLDVRDIALGGDLFLSRAAQSLDVLLAVHDALLLAAERGMRVTIINGNHDKVNPESTRGYCHIFDRHPNVLVADDYIALPCPDGQRFILHMVAYFPENGSFPEKLGKVRLDPDRLNYLYIHEGINGALSQPSDNELPVHLFEDFDRVFVGHYHNRCIIPATRIEYIGSSRQHNFGEDEEKGYTVLYSDGSHEFVKNRANTRYRVMDVPVEKAGIRLTDELAEIRAEGRYKVKVRVHGRASQLPSIDKRALFDAGASKVELHAEETETEPLPGGDLSERYDGRKISESYREFCTLRSIDDPEYGLMYLSQIDGTPCGN